MRDIPTQSLVTLLQPEEFNDLTDESENAITSTGITLSQSDLFQLGKAISTYSAGGDFYTDSGAADAYVLSAIGSKQTPEVLFVGQRFRFLPANDNTGAATVNPATLGVVNIKKADGVTDPSSGDIKANRELSLTYDGTNARIANESVSNPVTLDVNQTTHGFAVNDIIRVSGGAYTEAQADTVANAQAIGVVVAVADVDNFTVQFSGFTNLLTGLSANTLHFLDASTPGANTTTEPTISKPIIFAVSATTGWILPQRPIDASASAGKIIQIVNVQDGEVATGTTNIPDDDTIPQNTEGDEFMTLAITPTSASNRLKIDVVFIGDDTNNVNIVEIIAALFQDTTANALATAKVADTVNASWTEWTKCLTFTHDMVAGTTSSTTFKVRAAAIATLTFNGQNAARRFGGTMASSITITEYIP